MQPLSPYRTLARNGRNWHILHLGDDSVQFDFGSFALAVSRSTFQQIYGLAETALTAPNRPGCIAHAGSEASVWFDPGQGSLVIVYRGVMVRFQPHELVAFVCLCRKAGLALGEEPSAPPSAGCLN